MRKCDFIIVAHTNTRAEDDPGFKKNIKICHELEKKWQHSCGDHPIRCECPHSYFGRLPPTNRLFFPDEPALTSLQRITSKKSSHLPYTLNEHVQLIRIEL